MTIILIAAFIAITMIGKAIYKRYINPIMLFVGVQLIGLILLYGSSFITAELITPSIGYIYIASYLFFILGNLIGVRKKHFFTEKVYKSNVQIKENDETEIKYYETMIITLGIVLLISTLIYWASCISRFGIAAFFNNLLHTKASSTDVSNFVLYLKMISVFLSPYTLYYIIKFNKRKPILFAIIILTILSNIAYTRNVLFYIAILDLLVIAFSRPEGIKKEEKRKPVFYIVIVVGMYLFFTYTQSEFNKQFNISGSVFGKTVSSGLLTIISYFSGALATVGIYLDQINNTPFLGHSFRTLINFLNPLGLNINTTAYQPTHWVYIPFRYNTSSIQYYIFSEGNWPWTILFFFLFGYIFAKVYIWFKRKKSFSSMLALCFLSWMAVLSSREYIMVRLDSFFFIVFILITYMHEAGKLKRIVFRTRR